MIDFPNFKVYCCYYVF